IGMAPDDLIQPFQIDAHALRGRLVRLGAVIDTVLGRHDYPQPVAVMLGEMLVLTAGLAAALKFDGVFILQATGDGPITLMVADLTSGGEIRGYAKFDRDRLAQALATPGPGRPDGGPLGNSVPRLLGAGHLALTVDQGEHTERYQGIVELSGATLAECMQHYFRQSDQLQAGIKLAVGRVADAAGRRSWRAGAIMLQRLPPPEHAAAEPQDDAWRRALALMSAAGDEDLLDPRLEPNLLLYRLFHEDGVRVYRPRPLKVGCRCSQERVGEMLRAMPRAQVEDLTVDGVLTVSCQFCSQTYRYDAPALNAVLDGGRRKQA
ncbi:MAG: Hsp33 family molecular chaperone HslO, partial [Kiloniellales bacterium]